MVDDMINIAKTWLNRFKPDNAKTTDKNPQFHKIVWLLLSLILLISQTKRNILIRYPLLFINNQLHFKIF